LARKEEELHDCAVRVSNAGMDRTEVICCVLSLTG
jgi:hypothetical protein